MTTDRTKRLFLFGTKNWIFLMLRRDVSFLVVFAWNTSHSLSPMKFHLVRITHLSYVSKSYAASTIFFKGLYGVLDYGIFLQEIHTSFLQIL